MQRPPSDGFEAGLLPARHENGSTSLDVRADVELGVQNGGLHTNGIEEEVFPKYGNPAPVYGRDSVYKADSGSTGSDAALGGELLLSIKETRINKFLWVRKVLILAIIFSVSFSMIFALFQSLPKINGVSAVSADGKADAGEKLTKEFRFRFARNLEELKELRQVLEVYQKEHRRHVQVGIICLYLFLQTFVIPGSIFINILAGSLYGFYEALFLVLMLAGVGSSMCYCLSNYILREIVYYYFPDRCEWMAREVHRHRHHMLNYMLFIRLTPILPNWFINVASPLVGVPYRDFVIGTTVGLTPASIVGVKAGGILSKINSLSDLYNFWTIATMSFMAILVMLPVVIKSRYDRTRGSPLIKTT